MSGLSTPFPQEPKKVRTRLVSQLVHSVQPKPDVLNSLGIWRHTTEKMIRLSFVKQHYPTCLATTAKIGTSLQTVIGRKNAAVLIRLY